MYLTMAEFYGERRTAGSIILGGRLPAVLTSGHKKTRAFITILDKVGIRYAILGKKKCVPATLPEGPVTNSCSR